MHVGFSCLSRAAIGMIFLHSQMWALFILIFFLASVDSLSFQISRFDSRAEDIFYQGDAVPSVGAVELNDVNYLCRVGWATYAQKLALWDAETGKLTDFTTRFSFAVDIKGAANYGHGITFFLASVGFQIPPNSAGGFLGLFNTTTSDSSGNQIVLVEFDSFSNPEWDPPLQHVGINVNSIASSVYTPWNVSLHTGDTADVLVSYNSTTKYLSVSWKYRTTSNSHQNTSLSYLVDLSKVLPPWVMFGFSAATGKYVERHTLQSWEFHSSLEVKEPSGNSTSKKITIIIASTASGCALILGALAAFAVLWKRNQRQRKEQTAEEANLTSINDDLERGVGPKRFSQKELALVTNNFSNERKLGEGGFGAVYRGYIANMDLTVAVKKISKGSKQGKREYLTEVKIISRLRHRNLVQLIGWCHDREFLLVYEFMPNGSLDAHLFGKRNPLPWAVRHKIALGLASALLYLHEEWEQCVIHRDIKSSNVMLDSNSNVKLGDFGLARLMDHELAQQTTGLAGTLGYLAPEYISTGRASKESDVFSFGVVALEIATGRKSIDPTGMSSQKGLVEWVWDLYGSGQVLMAMDEKLQTNHDVKQVESLMIVGLWCAYPDRSLRPSIRQAIQVMNFEATMPNLPPKMPTPLYHVPTPLVSSADPFVTTSLQFGR